MAMKTSSRQNVCAAVERILFSDMATGVAKDLFTKLPNGVIPLSLQSLIVTPFNSTTNLLDLGNGSNGAAYANDIDVKAVAGTRVAATALPGLVSDQAAGGLQLKATRVDTGAAPTAGEVLVVLTYVERDKEQFSIG